MVYFYALKIPKSLLKIKDSISTSAVQDNSSTGVGWCVTTNSSGVSSGSCAINSAECDTRKPSGGYANFLTNESQCPDSCTIENMLYNSSLPTAVCDAPGLSKTRGLKCMREAHCDSGVYTAACYVVIENRFMQQVELMVDGVLFKVCNQ